MKYIKILNDLVFSDKVAVNIVVKREPKDTNKPSSSTEDKNPLQLRSNT